jgi:hypothetical protein
MDGDHKQAEGASRQAVGVLAGALVGFALAIQHIFSNYKAGAGELPWVTALGIVLAGCLGGLVLSFFFGGKEKADPIANPPPVVENPLPPRIDPPVQPGLDRLRQAWAVATPQERAAFMREVTPQG